MDCQMGNAAITDGECRYYLDKDTVFKTDWVNGNCVKIYE